MIVALALTPHNLKLQNLQSATKVLQSATTPPTTPPGLKKDADEIVDNIRKLVIPDVYTCMHA